MRLYMCIKGEYLPDPIKIRSISFDNRYLESGPPRIYIRIDRKYEECFQYDVRELKFFDKNGKVYFAAKTAWLHFRCYESDMHEDVKFRGIILGATDLEYPGYGTISKHYLNKILEDVCNAKLTISKAQRIKMEKEEKWKRDLENEPGYWERDRKLRLIEKLYWIKQLRKRRYAQMYHIYKMEYIYRRLNRLKSQLRVKFKQPVYSIFRPPKYIFLARSRCQ